MSDNPPKSEPSRRKSKKGGAKKDVDANRSQAAPDKPSSTTTAKTTPQPPVSASSPAFKKTSAAATTPNAISVTMPEVRAPDACGTKSDATKVERIPKSNSAGILKNAGGTAAATNKKEVNFRVDPGLPVADPVTNSDSAESRINPASATRPAPTQVGSGGESVVGGGATEKSKSELRAERRAKQEAQRAAKSAGKSGGSGGGGPATKSPAAGTSAVTASKPAASRVSDKGVKANEVVAVKVVAKKDSSPPLLPPGQKPPSVLKVGKLFSHLPQGGKNISVIQAAKDGIHGAIIRLGLQYASGVICGSNARCVALIDALLQVIKDFKSHESKEISDALCSMYIDPSMKFLDHCRPVSVGMKNVSKKLREEIVNLPKDLSENEAKERLSDVLTTFRQDDIDKAHASIVNFAKEKITGDDVILTYGCSHLVKQVLVAAHKAARFRVIVVDARPKLEGRSMFNYLVEHGIQCTYVLINAVSHVIQEATKVFLGAHALLANGYVMSRVGSSQVALVAKAFNKPVLVCCETYKFCELVQTDSFVFNELGKPDDLVTTLRSNDPLAAWKDLKYLNILNLYYDVTPPELVTVVINDVNLVPCTSVPVLLRVKPTKK